MGWHRKKPTCNSKLASRRDATTWTRLSETRIGSRRDASTCRRLRFEPLEDRRLLAIIADGFSDIFAQVSWVTGNEKTFLSADPAGHTEVFYQPNTEIGYIEPSTGNLLAVDFFPGTSSVFALDGEVTGHVSQLVGQHYTNGQLIAADGGNTLYHLDGSIMRSGGVWTYDAGTTLKSGGNWLWSNGRAMISGTVLRHPNNLIFRSTSGTIPYATGGFFYDASSTVLAYPNSLSIRNAQQDYFYEDGTTLETNDTIYYPDHTVMVESNGTVRNEDGNVSITPFTRYIDFSNSESQFDVDDTSSQVTTGIQSNAGGSMGAYIVRQKYTYRTLPPEPINLVVTAPDAETLRFAWANGGGSTVGYRVAVANSTSPPGDSAAGVDIANNFYEVTGLTPGQKVSIRVWARDSTSQLSHSVDAIGTAGAYRQATQNDRLIESGLSKTFIQTYDSVSRNVVFTVDRDNNFLAAILSYELGIYGAVGYGYINPENGDRLEAVHYEMPDSDLSYGNTLDFRVFGNIASIPQDAHYASGQLIRNGDVFYYDNGAVMRSANDNWYYQNGSPLKVGSDYFWSNGANMRVSGVNYYRSGVVLKNATTMNHENGSVFLNSTGAFYPNSSPIENASGNLFYEGAVSLFAANTFHYANGNTLINASGTPYSIAGATQTVPYVQVVHTANNHLFMAMDTDRLARYGMFGTPSNLSTYVLGDTVDYPALNGDFNHDDTTDAADYILWRKTAGSTFNLTADANGTIDQADYDTWRAHFGQTLPALGAAASAVAGVSDPGGPPITATTLIDTGHDPLSFADAFTPTAGLTEASYNFANVLIPQPRQAQPDLQLLAAIAQPLPTGNAKTSIPSRSREPGTDSHADDLSLDTLDDAFAELRYF